MNLKEFKEIVDWHYEQYKDSAEELQVHVDLSEPSAGGSASTAIKAIHKGIDWDNWKISIFPEQPLVRKTNKRQLKITDTESAFTKDLINTLTKYQPERNPKLILEVFKTIGKHYPQKKIGK